MAGTENPVSRFSEFFRSVASVPSGSEANSIPERSLVIDWQRLAEFDATLAHRLRDQPDATLGYAREALMTMAESGLSSSRLPQLRIRNLDVDTPGERLETVELGQLVSVSGMVVATTDVRPRLTVIAVECQQCGTITKGHSLRLTAPDMPCRSCGREEHMPVTTESDFVDTQHARLRVSDSATETEAETVHVRLDATLQPVTPGAAMTVTGVVRPCRRTELNRQATIQTRFIDSVGNSSRNKAHEPSPLPAGWTLSDLAAQSTYLTNITEAVAPSVPGFRRAKLALALQYVTPTPLGSTTAGTGPHLLLLAPNTGQRRRLLEGYCDLSAVSQYQSLAGEHSQPIVAAIEQGPSACWVESGPLVQAADGIAAVDGIDRAAESQQPLVPLALTETQVRRAKAGITISLDTCDQLVATAAPTEEDPDDVLGASPLENDALSAFDLHVSDSAAVTVSQPSLRRAWTGGIDTGAELREIPHEQLDTECYQSALTQARLLEQPKIEDAVQQRLDESRFEHSKIALITIAFARLCGQQSVRLRDIDRAERVVDLLASTE